MTTPLDVGKTLARVGPRLRDLRRRRGRTLASVAESTGISLSTLSRLESGRRRPALDLLLPLADIYGVGLDDLVGMKSTIDPMMGSEPIRSGRSIHIPLSSRSGAPIAFKSIHPGRTPRGPVRQGVHRGHDWIYVLRGRLQLLLDEEEHLLDTGQAAEFDTRIPHGFASATAEPVEVLNLFTPDSP